MAIPNTQPVVIPASEEKTFPHLWIKRISINSPNSSEGQLAISTVPYNADTGEIADVEPTVIRSNELWAVINNVPEAAQAMGAIFNAVPYLTAWLEE